MSKVLKKRLLTVALAIMLCSTLGAVASVKRLTVKADSTVAYEIVGASIRTTEPEGASFYGEHFENRLRNV